MLRARDNLCGKERQTTEYVMEISLYHQVFFTGKRGNKIDFNCFVFGSYFRSSLRADAVIFCFFRSFWGGSSSGYLFISSEKK